MPKFRPKKWDNPDRIKRSELTTHTRQFIADTERASGMKCRQLHEVRREDGTSTVYATFALPRRRIGYQVIALLDFSPTTGYVRVKY